MQSLVTFEFYVLMIVSGFLIWNLIDLILLVGIWYNQRFSIDYFFFIHIAYDMMVDILISLGWLMINRYVIQTSNSDELFLSDFNYASHFTAIFGVCAAIVRFITKSNDICCQ